LDKPVAPVLSACLDAGLVVLSAGPDVLRLAPPLTLTADEADRGLAVIGGGLAAGTAASATARSSASSPGRRPRPRGGSSPRRPRGPGRAPGPPPPATPRSRASQGGAPRTRAG